MPTSRMVLALSRYGRRRIGTSWMLGTIVTSTFQRGSASRFSCSLDEPLRAIVELTNRIQQSEPRRVSQSEKKSISSNITTVGLDEKKLKAELAREVCIAYCSLPTLKLPLSDDCKRSRLLLFLASECSTEVESVQRAISDLLNRDGASALPPPNTRATSTLRKACTPIYEEVLGYIIQCDVRLALPFLMSLREDTLRALQWIRSSTREDGRLRLLEDLDSYLLRTFLVWFSPGMLELQRITYETTPASVIETIATKEAVHPMKSLDDLRSRLGSGRRVFSLFHPMLHNKPLLFVHVALTHDVPSSMEHVMDLLPLDKPTCATFYSITNAQPSLAGIGLGEHLLKESIAFLRSEFPSLENFVTLSPIPKFRSWLEEKCRQNDAEGKFVDNTILSQHDWDNLIASGLLSSEHTSWAAFMACLDGMNFCKESGDPHNLALVEPILTKLAARYIALEKHRGKPLNGVARFHLGNGAIAHRINFGADLSRKGIRNSYGIMINYLYDFNAVDLNRRAFEETNQIQVSEDILRRMEAEHFNVVPQSKL